MLIWIAIANGIVWTGLFLFLLIWLSRNAHRLDAEISRLEAKLDDQEKKSTG